MDNLYNSRALAEALYKEKMMMHGVTRTHNRGLPTKVIQKEGTNKKACQELRGTVLAAVLKGDDGNPNLLACSIYDTKPVHILSSANVDVKWIVKTKKCMKKQK